MSGSPRLKQAAEAVREGAFAKAREICEQALLDDPNSPEALYLLGNALVRLGDLPGAQAALERARAGAPNVFVLTALGSVYASSERRAEAVAALQEALSLDPSFAWAHESLGALMKGAGDLVSARRHLEAALMANPNVASVIAGLAEIAALEDRDADAQALADKALAIEPGLAPARLVSAEMALRRGQFPDVLSQLGRLSGMEHAPAEMRVSVDFLRAQACDGLGRYAEAFEAYRHANHILLEHHRKRYENAAGVSSFATIATMKKFLSETDFARWRAPAPGAGLTPAFLVGFPRSGTTLLDQVLASHPDIESLEERQNLLDAYEALVAPPDGLDRWRGLTAEGAVTLRAGYWNRVRTFLGRDPRRPVFIDKMPLNTVLLPLIHTLFPAAKIIFALRDPRDVVVSCFTQRFRMNHAMFHFLSIESAARYYDAVMQVAQASRQRLPLKLHFVRYEDLVSDFDATASSLLSFLDLPWDDRVRDYMSTAKVRTLKTPSAPDVKRPLYSSSIGKWRRYAVETTDAFAPLGPWIAAYGYNR